MNWTKASAVAEILSSVAILITLVYLVVEIQQNSRATQADTRQEILASDQQFLENYIDSPELMALQYQAELSDDERIRLSYLMITFVRMRENNWLQYENGTLDDATWRAHQGSIVRHSALHRHERGGRTSESSGSSTPNSYLWSMSY